MNGYVHITNIHSDRNGMLNKGASEFYLKENGYRKWHERCASESSTGGKTTTGKSDLRCQLSDFISQPGSFSDPPR